MPPLCELIVGKWEIRQGGRREVTFVIDFAKDGTYSAQLVGVPPNPYLARYRGLTVNGTYRIGPGNVIDLGAASFTLPGLPRVVNVGIGSSRVTPVNPDVLILTNLTSCQRTELQRDRC
jgi:hypothetical protein